MPSRAFTLIELLAVLILMGLLSAIVGLSLAGRKTLADQREIADRLKAFDTQARVLAEGSPEAVSIVLDLSRRRIWVQKDDAGASLGPEFSWSEKAGIREVQFLDRMVSSGSIEVPLSRRGTTPSYAFSVGDSAGKPQWFFIVGLTGQVIAVRDQAQLQSLLHLASAGVNAH